MNADEILRTLNREQVDYLLIGGTNFLLRHLPELTWDLDTWVKDDAVSLTRLTRASCLLEAGSGRTEAERGPVATDSRWLCTQEVFCLTTAQGALEVFREVRGLEGRSRACKAQGVRTQTSAAIEFTGLSDEDMLACQEALPVEERKERRIQVLREAIRQTKGDDR
jgi:hypothetical protein